MTTVLANLKCKRLGFKGFGFKEGGGLWIILRAQINDTKVCWSAFINKELSDLALMT